MSKILSLLRRWQLKKTTGILRMPAVFLAALLHQPRYLIESSPFLPFVMDEPFVIWLQQVMQRISFPYLILTFFYRYYNAYISK